MDQLLLMSFSEPAPLTDGAPARLAVRMENPYRIWPFLLHQHGIRSKKEVKKLAKSMMRANFPDEA
jgi:hypothetical protein